MASSPVALILGAGPRVGASVAAAFVKDGYKVAVVSRKGTNDQTSEGYFSLKADFESPDTIPQIFSVVKKELQAAPSVVVYNAGGFTAPPDDKSVLSVPHQSLAKDLNLNIISPYVAAQEALKGWETLPGGAKSFIYTGNKANTAIMPFAMTMTLGVGKAGSAYWVGIADKLYSERGYRYVVTPELLIF